MSDIIPNGTVCRIRTWESMCEEYKWNRNFSFIDVNGIYFLEKMKYLCGKTFTVKSHGLCDIDSVTVRYYSVEDVEIKENGHDRWIITAGMLEEDEDDDDFVSPDLSELFT